MSIHFVTTDVKPESGTLVVCAGTVTCTNTSQMGSGFYVFKSLFNQDMHIDSPQKTWSGALQSLLDNFHNKKEKMPAYIRIAQQDGLIGGIATVPFVSNTGLTFELFSTPKQRKEAYIREYIEAVKLAVLDAIALNQPLYIQPLGIGVYGGNQKKLLNYLLKHLIKQILINRLK